LRLPGDESLERAEKIRWAPGALDGVLGRHVEPEESSAKARRLAKLVDRVARTGDRGAEAQSYALLKDESVLPLIDPAIRLMSEWRSPFEPHLALFAFQLATRSKDRGPVKAGIALLGAMKLAEHQETVITLGKHDEFTLYAAVALRNMFVNPTVYLWELARHVDGWGRIQTVERLVPTDNAEVRRWLRTEGYKNSIMYEYLALTAATHGYLREALESSEVTDKDLIAAGEIIEAMITADGGPGPGMDAYSDAAATSLAYLQHASDAPPDLRHLLTARAIFRYLSEDGRDSATRLKCGWSEAAVASVRARASDLIHRPLWESLIREYLESDSEDIFYRANRAAREAGLDAFAWHWRRLQAMPAEPSRWFDAMQTANADRIDQLVDFAERAIPLREIATGPADEMGLGKRFDAHSCLDYVLQDLKRFPGKGLTLIFAGLRSPVVRNRHLALSALEAWERPLNSEGLLAALTRASREEMDEKLAKRISSLLGDA